MPKIDVAPMLGELWHIAIAFWPMWTLFLLAGCVKFGWELRNSRRLGRSGINEIDVMNGTEFERRLAVLFHDLGYAVKLTQDGADHGADLVIEKDGRKTFKPSDGRDASATALSRKSWPPRRCTAAPGLSW